MVGIFCAVTGRTILWLVWAAEQEHSQGRDLSVSSVSSAKSSHADEGARGCWGASAEVWKETVN